MYVRKWYIHCGIVACLKLWVNITCRMASPAVAQCNLGVHLVQLRSLLWRQPWSNKCCKLGYRTILVIYSLTTGSALPRAGKTGNSGFFIQQISRCRNWIITSGQCQSPNLTKQYLLDILVDVQHASTLSTTPSGLGATRCPCLIVFAGLETKVFCCLQFGTWLHPLDSN